MKNGQLQAHPNTRPTKGHKANRHGMVNETQATHQYAKSIQVEGTPQCSWWATRARRALLGHLRPNGDLANHPPVSDPLPPP